jgi:phage shock protein E
MRTHLTRTFSFRMATAGMVVAAITGISACSSSAPASTMASPSTSESGSTASTGQHLAAGEFATASTKPATIVIDVRTPAEYAGGHLPKAQNIDFKGSDFAARIAALDKNATYAVYCHSGMRSAAAMKQMAAADFTHLFDLSGGITAWQSIGGPEVMGGS